MQHEFNAWKVVMEAAGTRSDQKMRNFYENTGGMTTIPLSEKLSKYKAPKAIYEQDIGL